MIHRSSIQQNNEFMINVSFLIFKGSNYQSNQSKFMKNQRFWFKL